jgi:hypothetical protein
VGAGAGALVGKLFGIGRAMKGGIGSASITLGASPWARWWPCNALGDVIDPATGPRSGRRAHRRRPRAAAHPRRDPGRAQPNPLLAGTNTTLGIVATDAVLTKAQAHRLAQVAHDGLARAINPVHTMSDGDTVFALGTGKVRTRLGMMRLATLAAEVTARAVVRAVRAARGITVGTDHWPAACDLPAAASRHSRMNHRRDPAAMPESLRLHPAVAARPAGLCRALLVLLMLLLLALAYWWLDPNPPRRVTLATGPAQSAYAEFGQRYRKALAARASRWCCCQRRFVRQPATAAQGRADLGFVQGGSARTADTGRRDGAGVAGQPVPGAGLAVLPRRRGTRATGSDTLGALAQLQGLRVNVGTAGSGVPHLMNALFELNRLDAGACACRSWTRPRPPVAFLGGRDRCTGVCVGAGVPDGADAAADARREAAGLRAERGLFTPPAVPDAGHAAARCGRPGRRYPRRRTCAWSRPPPRCWRAPVCIRRSCSCSRRPRSTCTAMPAGSAARSEFPIAASAEYPLAREAERTIRNGVPLLQRYLPFSLANLLERMWLSLGIIIALLLPLSRVVPPLYEFRIRSRVFRWYAQLRDIETRVRHTRRRAAGAAAGTRRGWSCGSARWWCRCRTPTSCMPCATISRWCAASWSEPDVDAVAHGACATASSASSTGSAEMMRIWPVGKHAVRRRGGSATACNPAHRRTAAAWCWGCSRSAGYGSSRLRPAT